LAVTAPQDPPAPEAQPATQKISAEDLSRMLAASGPSPEPPPDVARAMRRKLVAAVLIAAIGVGASIMSCVGQSFSLRQARAMEGIEEQLKVLQSKCVR
jgi:hypothetical protein